MREIKFRGKAIMSIEELELMGIEHDSGWVYGNLIKNGNRPMITADILEEIDESIYPEWWAVVEPKSIGQYTGLKDKNGKEIYEGDIISTDLDRPFNIVVFRNGAFMFQCHDSGKDYYDYMFSVEEESDRWEYGEVIGNIYENPELLEDEE